MRQLAILVLLLTLPSLAHAQVKTRCVVNGNVVDCEQQDDSMRQPRVQMVNPSEILRPSIPLSSPSSENYIMDEWNKAQERNRDEERYEFERSQRQRVTNFQNDLDKATAELSRLEEACKEAGRAKRLKTAVRVVECEQGSLDTISQKYDIAAIADILQLGLAKSRVIAEKLDKKKISDSEAKVEDAEITHETGRGCISAFHAVINRKGVLPHEKVPRLRCRAGNLDTDRVSIYLPGRRRPGIQPRQVCHHRHYLLSGSSDGGVGRV